MYLPGGGLSSEELMIERAVRGIKLGLQKYAAIGYGLQRGGAFVWKAESNEKLHRKQGDQELHRLYLGGFTSYQVSKAPQHLESCNQTELQFPPWPF